MYLFTFILILGGCVAGLYLIEWALRVGAWAVFAALVVVVAAGVIYKITLEDLALKPKERVVGELLIAIVIVSVVAGLALGLAMRR